MAEAAASQNDLPQVATSLPWDLVCGATDATLGSGCSEGMGTSWYRCLAGRQAFPGCHSRAVDS